MRRAILAVAALAAGAVAVDGLVWVAACQVLRRQTASLLATADRHGWTVTTGDQALGGWPWAATITIDRPAISGGARSIPGGLSWSADRLVARVSPLHPLTLVMSPEGQQFVRLSHAPDIGFTAGRAEARLGLWTGPNAWASFEADGVAGGIAGSRNPQDVQIASLRLRMRQERAAPVIPGQASESVSLDVRAHGIGLPDVGRWPLGATVGDAGAELVLVALPSQGTGTADLPGRTRAAAQAAAWRNAGGRVRIGHAALRWGPLRLDGAAVLGLDDALQPAGSGKVQVVGTDAALDAAASGGLIAPGVALTAKAVLGLMPRGEGGAVRLPFTLRDRTVSVGQIPLARIGEIVW